MYKKLKLTSLLIIFGLSQAMASNLPQGDEDDHRSSPRNCRSVASLRIDLKNIQKLLKKKQELQRKLAEANKSNTNSQKKDDDSHGNNNVLDS